MPVLAYHIIWTTYGTWLPGDRRGWIKTRTRGIQAPDAKREAAARQRMTEEPIILSADQRRIVETTVREHCRIRQWQLHALSVRSNHVHVVVTADRSAEEVMNQLCSRKLSDSQGLIRRVAVGAGRRRWFTEDGDKELIKTEQYLANAIRYVNEGQ